MEAYDDQKVNHEEASPPKAPETPKEMREAKRRKVAALWYERFESKRITKLKPKHQRLVQMAFLLSALSMVVFGVQMRSEKMDRLMHKDLRPVDPAIFLTRELHLEPASAQILFPLWENYQRDLRACNARERKLQQQLKELTQEFSLHNALVEQVGEELLASDSMRTAIKRDLLRAVRVELDQWKSARLQELLESELSGTCP